MTIKRYDFGTEYKGNLGMPAIIGKVDGRYVRYDDYAACVTHNELLLLQLQRLTKNETVAQQEDGLSESDITNMADDLTETFSEYAIYHFSKPKLLSFVRVLVAKNKAAKILEALPATQPCVHQYHYFGDYPVRRCNRCKKLEPAHD